MCSTSREKIQLFVIPFFFFFKFSLIIVCSKNITLSFFVHYRKMRQSRWVEKWQPSCRAPVSPRTSSSSHRTSRSPNPRQHLRYSGLGCVCFYFERLTAVCFWLCLRHIWYCGKKKERISYLIFKVTHLWSSRGLSTVTTFAPRMLEGWTYPKPYLYLHDNHRTTLPAFITHSVWFVVHI